MAKKPPSAPERDEPAASKVPDVPPAPVGNNATNKGSPPVWKKRLYGNSSFVECAVGKGQAKRPHGGWLRGAENARTG